MNTTILYLEGSSGISGDMTVAALLDLGASEAYLREQIGKLPLSHYEVITGRTVKKGISGATFTVNVQEDHQPHRTYQDIESMILSSNMDRDVKMLAIKIFYVLAKAEAKVHGDSVSHVHFHEVGAVDSIIDIVGAAACICNLGITEVALGVLREGCGTVWCQHGEMPVPVPATAELIQSCGLPVQITATKGEMITPTGAAIAAALRTRKLPEKGIRILKIGVGAGTKDFDHPNVLRVMLVQEEKAEDDVWVLESNMDDCTGEQMGFLQECLFELGVKDAVYVPIYMKKNRPAYLLKVICDQELVEKAEDLIFRESTTIGIRRYRANRSVLERKIEKVMTSYGEIAIKYCKNGEMVYAYPEYEDVKKVAKAHHESYRSVYDEAVRSAWSHGE